MLRAMAETVAEKGFAATVVADVVSRAGVSRKTFYEHFPTLQACFLATFDESVAAVRAVLETALDPALSAEEQCRQVLESYLGLMAAEPKVAKTNLVDVFAVGPAAAARRHESLVGFAGMLAELHGRLRAEGRSRTELTAFDYELLTGAISQAVTLRVATGDTERLPELAPALHAFLLRALGVEDLR
jgi:AcrR family transcriptional regulator